MNLVLRFTLEYWKNKVPKNDYVESVVGVSKISEIKKRWLKMHLFGLLPNPIDPLFRPLMSQTTATSVERDGCTFEAS